MLPCKYWNDYRSYSTQRLKQILPLKRLTKGDKCPTMQRECCTELLINNSSAGRPRMPSLRSIARIVALRKTRRDGAIRSSRGVNLSEPLNPKGHAV